MEESAAAEEGGNQLFRLARIDEDDVEVMSDALRGGTKGGGVNHPFSPTRSFVSQSRVPPLIVKHG